MKLEIEVLFREDSTARPVILTGKLESDSANEEVSKLAYEIETKINEDMRFRCHIQQTE